MCGFESLECRVVSLIILRFGQSAFVCMGLQGFVSV